MVNEYQFYIAALIACGLASAALAVGAGRMNPARLPKWESLPRHRYYGGILAFLCLLWCVPHAQPIVWDWLLPWLYPLAVIFTVLGFLFLDYLLARAVGGLCILLTYYLVHAAFTFHTPALPLFAVICWGLGIAGLFVSGKPHLLRDFIRQLAKSVRMRYTAVAYFAVFGALCLTLGVIHGVRG
ncbi:MAG: hypothetical protein PHH77_08455 [Victivallaceae bacterium]|nr:hypothetical protein [Victivallaceae bacterium]